MQLALLDSELARRHESGDARMEQRPAPPAPPRPAPRVEPFTITRQMLAGKVFGAGYPSLPTMTIEQVADWEYSLRAKSKADAAASAGSQGAARSGDGAPDKDEDEDDSDAALQRARAHDEFLDGTWAAARSHPHRRAAVPAAYTTRRLRASGADHRRGSGNRMNMG